MIIEDSTGQAEIQNCSRVPDAWSINEGRDLLKNIIQHILHITYK